MVRSHSAQQIQHRGDGRTDQGRTLDDSQRAGGHSVAVLLRNSHSYRPDDDTDGRDVDPPSTPHRGCGLVIGTGLRGQAVPGVRVSSETPASPASASSGLSRLRFLHSLRKRTLRVYAVPRVRSGSSSHHPRSRCSPSRKCHENARDRQGSEGGRRGPLVAQNNQGNHHGPQQKQNEHRAKVIARMPVVAADRLFRFHSTLVRGRSIRWFRPTGTRRQLLR